MKKTKNKKVCAQCGGMIEPSAAFCPLCGEPAPVQEPAIPKHREERPGIWSILGSIMFGLLLAMSIVLLIGLLFVHALSQNVPIPAVGPASEELLAGFFISWFPFVLGGLLVLIPLLLLLLIHRCRIRRVFFTLGISTVAAAALSAVFGLFGGRILGMLSEVWQEVLVNSTVVFQEFSTVCAVILAMFGAGCLSVYACIHAVKGEIHEKDT